MAKGKVKIVEVGLRDGLQNESTVLSTHQRFELLEKLIAAGTKTFEVGAFVSPKWVPQMAVSKELTDLVLKKYPDQKKFHSSVLVPNEVGLKGAMETGIKEIAIFASSSETFSQKNINCSIEESFQRFEPIMKIAKKNKIKVRGYLSVCFGCPFEGDVPEKKVVELAKRLYKMGCYEISIGDTIGVATVNQVDSLFKKLKKVIPITKLAGHFHDTRGQALANILEAYKVGVRVFDSSIGGLGGCPYAKGATGNVATEDVVYMFNGMDVNTGLDIDKLCAINRWLEPQMNHALSSRVGKVGVLKV
ncbi:MAG: hydroxymethylglutaryl-CoA lyase [Pseudobdellovibrio sp.]|nr:hydroxymethylglutaryl-CoA lyase [Pseudobdellovibrio sp.]